MRQTRVAFAAALFLAVGSVQAAEIENPEFTSWAKFKKGTSVTLKTTSTAGGVTSELLMTTTLTEVGADKLVVETVTVTKFNGMEFKGDPEKREVAKTIKVPDGAKKPDPKDLKVEKPAVEEGTEALKLAGTEIKAKWFKTKVEVAGNKTESKTWMSDDVPGNLVKMEAITTGAAASTVKLELVEFKKP